MDDTDTPSNNGVWQLIAGNANWTYFSDNLDFIDEEELAEAIDANTGAWTAADGAEAEIARAAEEAAQNTANLALDNAADAQSTADEALALAARDTGSIFESLPPLLADRDG
jgi:hypothetical protein